MAELSKHQGGLSSRSTAAAQSSTKDEEATASENSAAALALVACQAALVTSPAASRAALDKHHSSIDPDVAHTLLIVGGYNCKEGRSPLHESVMKGDIATTPSLIKAGADLNAKATSKQSKGVTPLDLAAKSPCRALLKHHTSVLAILAADPSALVSAAIAHCATLSTPEEPIPATRVSLSTAHLEPSFTWAPPASRTAVVGWARGIFIVQLASCTQPFADLPDDCAGDVLEYLEMTVTRTESLQLMPSPYSPKAQAWVRAVIAAAVAMSTTTTFLRAAERGDLVVVQDCLTIGVDIDVRAAGIDSPLTRGFTALIYASSKGHTDIVDFLLQAGADTNAKDKAGKTALIWATEYSLSEIVQLFRQAGVELSDKEKCKMATPRFLMPPIAVRYYLRAYTWMLRRSSGMRVKYPWSVSISGCRI